MMKTILAFVLFCLALLPVYSQQTDLQNFVNKLQAACGKVEAASKTYEQELKLLGFSTAQYSITEVDTKGNRTVFVFDFNFADLDVNTVRQVTQKDVIKVMLSVKNKLRLVKHSKNGEAQSYDDELSIYAKDGDQAKLIIDLVKKSIPLGEKITASKLKLNSYQEMVTWLIDHVKEVSTGSRSYLQSLRPGATTGLLILTRVENDGKTSQQEDFSFNLADINLNTVNFKISGNRFGINLETLQQIKSVKVMRDGKNRPFDNELFIYTNDVDEARDIKTVLTLVIPQAEKRVKADLPTYKNNSESLDKIFSLVRDVKLSDRVQAQTSILKCATEIVITEQTKSANTTDKFEFNWMDVNSNNVQIKTSGEKMTVELPILEKKKLITHSKNGKFDGYENEINIYTEDFEVARRLKHAIEKTTEGCKAVYQQPFGKTNASMLDWLKKNVVEVTVDQASKKQILEQAEEGNENKLKLTQIEIKGNTSAEEVFEFNLADVNASTVNYDVKGKWLLVTFETNFKNKVIKSYKNGKIQPYTNSIDIVAKDVDTARSIIIALKGLTENFKGK